MQACASYNDSYEIWKYRAGQQVVGRMRKEEERERERGGLKGRRMNHYEDVRLKLKFLRCCVIHIVTLLVTYLTCLWEN